jgi:hypothetical protein
VKTTIAYPVPCESEEVLKLFLPFVERFATGLRNYNTKAMYHIDVILNGGTPKDHELAKSIFNGLSASFYIYPGSGCDFGSYFWRAKNCQENDFQVCMSTRSYPWRDGWLKNLVDARIGHGPGLYGTSISMEGGKLHTCTRVFAADSRDFASYPHEITSRDQGTFVEVYDGNLYEWFRCKGKQNKVVYGSGAFDADHGPDSPCWTEPNIFRKGDQSNLIVKDKHTDVYRDASDSEKRRLESICYPCMVTGPG